jgi:hypothetical protein
VFAVIFIAFAFRGRGAVQRILDAVVAIVAVWTVIAACAFTGATLRWLSFSAAAAFWSLGVCGLVLHQAFVERRLRGVVGMASRDRRPHLGRLAHAEKRERAGAW